VKSPQIPESRIRPGCETLTISAGADAARRALRPRSKLAWFYSAPLAGFYSAVDIRAESEDRGTDQYQDAYQQHASELD
jgi:hypothetical protein